jgi:uncharacterized protein YndB with AHSA1/START domain
MSDAKPRHDDSFKDSLQRGPGQRGPGQRGAGGELEAAGDLWRLRFTRKLAHSPEKVWRALTQPEHLKAWFPDEIEFPEPLETGARVRFASPYRTEPFESEISECVPGSVLEFRWDTNDTLRFEVRPDGTGSELTLLDTFDELGKAARDGAGWHACLDTLEYELAGSTPPWDSSARWSEVHPDYVARFPQEASTIGPPADHPTAN